jgi:hypothetical protein
MPLSFCGCRCSYSLTLHEDWKRKEKHAMLCYNNISIPTHHVTSLSSVIIAVASYYMHECMLCICILYTLLLYNTMSTQLSFWKHDTCFGQNLILGTFSITITHSEQKRSPRTDWFLFQDSFCELHWPTTCMHNYYTNTYYNIINLIAI